MKFVMSERSETHEADLPETRLSGIWHIPAAHLEYCDSGLKRAAAVD